MNLSPLLKVDPSINDDTILYRTIDFFGATDMILNNRLMFTRADVFSDKNEGVDRLLAQLNQASPNSGCGMGWNDATTARRSHEEIKKSHFISCWSQNPESVAMWSLYSLDFCSVRISTTVRKLKIAVSDLLNRYSLVRLTENDLDKKQIISVEGVIAPVNYHSLQDLSKRVSRRLKARERIYQRYINKGLKAPSFEKVNPRYWEREQQRELKELNTTCHLKDISFKHEEEVRLAIRFGEVPCDRMLEYRDLMNPNHEYHKQIHGRLMSSEYLTNLAMSEREFGKSPNNLIETVALDPRIPKHKADFMLNWFQNKDISVVKSSCFGSIAESFQVYPEW